MQLCQTDIECILRGRHEEVGYQPPTITYAAWRRYLVLALDEHGLSPDISPWTLAEAEGFKIIPTNRRSPGMTSANRLFLPAGPEDRVWLIGHHERVHGWAIRLGFHDLSEADAWHGTAVWARSSLDRCPSWFEKLVLE